MLDGLQEILFTLRQNKLRTLLTAFGVFWGIFMLVLLLGAGRGMQNGIYEDFGSDVLDFIIVWTGTTTTAYHGMPPGRAIRLTLEDIEAVRQQVPGIRLLSAERFVPDGGSINYQGKNSNAQVLGVPDEYFMVKDDVPFNFGRKPNPLDQDEIRKVVVIGSVVAERLFAKGEDPVGKYVRVKDVLMKVVGVFYDKGNRSRNSERVLMPLTTMQKMYGDATFTDPAIFEPDGVIVIKGKGPSVENVALHAFDEVVAHIRHKFPGRNKSYTIEVIITETENNIFSVRRSVTV